MTEQTTAPDETTKYYRDRDSCLYRERVDEQGYWPPEILVGAGWRYYPMDTSDVVALDDTEAQALADEKGAGLDDPNGGSLWPEDEEGPEVGPDNETTEGGPYGGEPTEPTV